MGLDVGVVKTTYLERPGQPIYGFLWDLMADPEVGLDDGQDEVDGFWDGGGAENAFYEFCLDGLINRANGWATEQNLSPAQRNTLLDWIENLPYRDEPAIVQVLPAFLRNWAAPIIKRRQRNGYDIIKLHLSF